MSLAKDLMTPLTPHLSFDSTVEEALKFFATHPHPFVPISAGKDRIHGVLTEGNLVRIYLRYQTQKSKDALIFYRDCFEPAQLVLETEHFHEVVKKVMTAVGYRVLVINGAGDFIGTITAKDILPLIAGQRETPLSSEKAWSELKSQLYFYESFFSKSPFMMHSVNSQGFIQMANEMLHKVLGYDYGELIGKTIFDLYPKENHSKAQAGIQTILNKGYHDVVKSQMVGKSGEKIDVELASRALQDPHQTAVGTMTVSRPLDMSLLLKVLDP